MCNKNDYDAYSQGGDFGPLLSTLKKLIGLADLSEDSNNEYSLSQNDILCLKSNIFYEKALKNPN